MRIFSVRQIRILKTVKLKIFFQLLAIFSVLLTGCTERPLTLTFGDAQQITGKLSGYDSGSSLSVKNLTSAKNVNAQSNQTALSCSSPQVAIYKLSSSGVRIEPALATTPLNADGSYSFATKALGLKFQKSFSVDPLIIVISGCTSGVYSRPITGAKDQNVTLGSSLLSYVLNTNQKDKLASALLDSTSTVESLISSLSQSTSLEAAYDYLAANVDAQNLFNQLFGASFTILNNAAPEIVSSTLPQAASELSALLLNVSVVHWSSDYNPVYEWKLDSTVIGRSATLNYMPKGNSQGSHTLTVTIGENDNSGNIDTSKPVKIISQPVVISNNALPVAPNFSVTIPTVVGSVPINSRSLTLSLNTGFDKANCDTFSSLALTENDNSVPDASLFTITCSQAVSQTMTMTLVSFGDGEKNLRLWAMDASGEISQAASAFTLFLDTGVPTVSITNTPLALSNSSAQSFTFSGDDNGGVIDHYECKMDAEAFSSCSSPKSYSGLIQGDHTFTVKAIDTAGNTSVVDAKSWHIDLTNPVLSITGNPDSITNSLSSTFTFLASDSGGGSVANYLCQLDSATSFTTCSAIQNYTLTAGSHTLNAKVTDSAGNTSLVQTFSWTIDTTAPSTLISSKPTSLTNSQTGNFSFAGTDTGGGSIASYECAIDGGAFSSCNSPKSYTGLAASIHTFQVRSHDTAGNIGSATSYSWTIDLTTPMAVINSNPDNLTNQTTAAFTFSANPPPAGSIVGYECNLNNAGWVSCTSPKSYTGLVQGSQNFQVRSIDNNSNASTPTSYSWSIDTTLPVVVIASNPTSLNNFTSASFSFSATDSGGGTVASYSCKLDSGSYSSCSSPTNLSSLAQGTHTYYVTATDSAGNVSVAATYTWTVDLTAPSLTLSSTPSSITSSTSAAFSFSAIDSGGATVSTYSCSVDGGAATVCTSPKSYTGLASGSHTFSVTVTDSAGNISNAETYNWTIDTTAPTLSITATPNSITNSTSASFSFSATDSGGGSVASYQCKLDSGSYSTCTSAKSYSSLSAGAHTFYVTATDTANNTNVASTYAWTIDTTPPTISITTPSANATIVPLASLTSYSVAGTCSENGLVVSITGAVTTSVLCSSSTWSANLDLSALADGTLSIVANQTDAAGNSTASAAKTFIKDTTAPVITITTPTALQGNSSNGSVSWSATELNVAASTNFTVEIYNGSSWSSVGTKAATAGSNVNLAYTLALFPVPNVDVSAAKIRVSLVDAAGNSVTSQSGNFLIDSTAPVISFFQLAGGASTTALPSVVYSLMAADSAASANSGLYQLQITENATPATNDWVPFSNSGGYTLTQTNNTKIVRAFVKDNVGNISSANNYTISLEYGAPPTVVVTAPASASGYNSGDNVHISWSCAAGASSTVGLDAAPVRVKYTADDGINFTDISGWIPNNISSSTGNFNWTLPAGITVFRLLVECKSEAGVVTSAYSSHINTGGWSIFAGDPSNFTENVNATVALMSRPGGSFQSMSSDSQGNVFYERGSAIMKIDSKTGLVSRFAGDPNSSACTLQAGQDPLTNVSFNKLGSSIAILGPSSDRQSILFSTCSKTWSLNTTTRALKQIHTSYFNLGGFLSRSAHYYYHSNNRIYVVDLTQINATPSIIFGNGTCSATIAAPGTAADQSPIIANVTNACGSEIYVMTNPDETKIWVSCWSSAGGCGNAARLNYDSVQQKYLIESSSDTSIGSSGRYARCVASFVSNNVYCSERYNSSLYARYNTLTSTTTNVSIGNGNVFIRYAATPSGMVSLSSNNILMSHVESSDASVAISQIGGSDIEFYGNGTDLSKLAFSATNEIAYAEDTKKLLVMTNARIRNISLAVNPVSTTSFSSNYGYFITASTQQYGTTSILSKNGSTFANFNYCTAAKFPFDGTSFTTTIELFKKDTPCMVSVVTQPHPVTDGTILSGNIFGFSNTISAMARPLIHSNGKIYFFVKNRTTDMDGLIYSVNGTVINVIAGKTGATGYAPSDHGTTAVAAQLKDVRYITEVPTGWANAGDLLVLDNDRIRLITITSEFSSPKIYDLTNLTMATGYAVTTTNGITDAYYDFNSELTDNGVRVLGSGRVYYITSSNVIRKFAPAAATNASGVTSAVDTAYIFAGTTLSPSVDGAKIRLVLTPSGLLITQPNKNRILRVDP